MAIITRLVICTHKPHERVVEPRFVDVEDRDGNAQPSSWPAIGLLEIRTARFFQPLYAARRIG